MQKTKAQAVERWGRGGEGEAHVVGRKTKCGMWRAALCP
jgi:hypothetical protein